MKKTVKEEMEAFKLMLRENRMKREALMYIGIMGALEADSVNSKNHWLRKVLEVMDMKRLI